MAPLAPLLAFGVCVCVGGGVGGEGRSLVGGASTCPVEISHKKKIATKYGRINLIFLSLRHWIRYW